MCTSIEEEVLEIEGGGGRRGERRRRLCRVGEQEKGQVKEVKKQEKRNVVELKKVFSRMRPQEVAWCCG